jgi:hypothetical protein
MTLNLSHLVMLAQELHRHLRKSRESDKERLPSLETNGAQEEAAIGLSMQLGGKKQNLYNGPH